MCIFRFTNTLHCCPFSNKCNYCKLHINNENIIYDIIFKAIGYKTIENYSDIYLIFKYIYINKHIYVKEYIFKKILDVIIIDINIFYNLFNFNNFNNLNKKEIIHKIFLLNLNTFNLIKTQKNNIHIIKRNIYKFIIKNNFYSDNLIINNDYDPFTFELIKDIDVKERFVFKENNIFYCFKANEFKYFMESNGNWNPYTKKTIDKNIMRNLNIFIKINNLSSYNNLNKYNWNSINQAFTDVSQIIEKIGFYNNTEWFIKLTPKQIFNIIRIFKIMHPSSNFFNSFNENNIFYDFAKGIINMFENPDNFFICCIFMKSIAIYSNDFYNNLPDWLSDIETPVIIVNNSNLIYLVNTIDP